MNDFLPFCCFFLSGVSGDGRRWRLHQRGDVGKCLQRSASGEHNLLFTFLLTLLFMFPYSAVNHGTLMCHKLWYKCCLHEKQAVFVDLIIWRKFHIVCLNYKVILAILCEFYNLKSSSGQPAVSE